MCIFLCTNEKFLLHCNTYLFHLKRKMAGVWMKTDRIKILGSPEVLGISAGISVCNLAEKDPTLQLVNGTPAEYVTTIHPGCLVETESLAINAGHWVTTSILFLHLPYQQSN